ncbi:hypothetical protein J7K74_03625 [Candidatus Woesearchaeota archaeon]|nr:hypothetical protein [Candidatus Woesearchaeota archaeon]
MKDHLLKYCGSYDLYKIKAEKNILKEGELKNNRDISIRGVNYKKTSKGVVITIPEIDWQKEFNNSFLILQVSYILDQGSNKEEVIGRILQITTITEEKDNPTLSVENYTFYKNTLIYCSTLP